jgi:hypothetical protein
MKGDFSRLTGRKAARKHFDAVLKQQGRVQLDSDWNELISIIEHQREVRTIDIIGQFGAPLHDSGFEIIHTSGVGNDLLISTGRFYAEGLLCETTPASKLPILNFMSDTCLQVDDFKIDGKALQEGDWVQVITDESPDGIITQIGALDPNTNYIETTDPLTDLRNDSDPNLKLLLLFSKQADFPDSGIYDISQNRPRTDLIYLDAWQRHITTVEDPELREVALGGPDTDTRTKVIAQVKVLPLDGPYNCSDKIPSWEDFVKSKTSSGRLTTSLNSPNAPTNPCQLGESGGYFGLENRLYRVEIHDIVDGEPRFKWSRDNAAFAYPIEFINSNPVQIRVKEFGKDKFLKLKELDFVEISGDTTDLNHNHNGSGTIAKTGTIAKILLIEGDVFTLDTNISAHSLESNPKVRRWDTSSLLPNVLNNVTKGRKIPLEDGIELKFSGAIFQPGDYWVFYARTQGASPLEILDKEPPLGIKHHYFKLAISTVKSDGTVEIEDCRPEFPPLTEISGGCCTVTVGKNETYKDIQKAIDSLKGGPGTVCVKPGVYIIDEPIVIENGQDITVKGCEGKPYIINTSNRPSAAAVFEVRDSRIIDIHDFYCLSYRGDIVVSVENTLWFNLSDCVLVGAGTARSDLASGVVTCQGFTFNTSIRDNLMLGRIGVRYAEEAEQQLNLHFVSHIERNIIFAVENGVVQEADTTLAAFDLHNNLMLGLGLSLLAKEFMPESLFKAVSKAELHSEAELKAAAETRKGGKAYESVGRKNTEPLDALEYSMRMEADSASHKASLAKNATGIVVVENITAGAIADFSGNMIDVSISDNILIGSLGITTHMAAEAVVDKNLVWVRETGIKLGNSMGFTIASNFMAVSAGNGIELLGALSVGLSIQNNLIQCNGYGINAGEIGNLVKNQIAYSVQIGNNLIATPLAGIFLANRGLFLWDISVLDNSITGPSLVGVFLYGISDQLHALEVNTAMQRVVQGNSITGTGSGIVVRVPGCEILDNNINITSGNEASDSRGIQVYTERCTIANNTIKVVNVNSNNIPPGGILLSMYQEKEGVEYHQIDVRHNNISGGSGNGIEIGSNLNGLAIEGNEISGMHLNGIAVQEHVTQVDNLRIASNHIHHCLQNILPRAWWKFAGIVLTNTRKTQILDNVVDSNATQLTAATMVDLGAFYAERINEIIISGNQFTNNGPLQGLSRQAVIQVPIAFGLTDNNSDIQIVNNIVKSNTSPALEIGDYWCFFFRENRWIRSGLNLVADIDFQLTCFASDYNAVISNNHFESPYVGTIVNLHISYCVFASNLVLASADSNSVSLGYGSNVMANGNVISGPIVGAGAPQVIVNNLEY